MHGTEKFNRIMTRNEAIEHARYVRNLSRDASVIALDADVIDAILASPWHKVSEELPKDRTFLVTNSVKDVPDFCYYQKNTDRWIVTTTFSVGFTLSDLRKKYTHWMEIPPVD